MSLFIDNTEALEFTKGKKLFKLRSRDMTVICRKTGKNSYETLVNPSIAEEKIRANIIADKKDSDVFITIDFRVFDEYDKREQEIAERKQIVKDLRKSSKKILSIKHAIACNGFQGKTCLVDLDNRTFKKLDSDLIEPDSLVPYHESTIRTAIFDSQINQHKKQYERNKKLWESL